MRERHDDHVYRRGLWGDGEGRICLIRDIYTRIVCISCRQFGERSVGKAWGYYLSLYATVPYGTSLGETK
jgi:hypothetical protein